MLHSFRKLSKSWFAYILSGLLVISFGVFFGIGEFLTGGGDRDTIVSVGSQRIKNRAFQEELSRSMQLAMRNMKDLDGSGSKQEIAQLQKIMPSVVMRQMVLNSIIMQEAKMMNMVTGSDSIAKIIKEIPAFQDEDGEFSSAVFKTVLQNNNLTEKAFLEEIRVNTTKDNFQKAVAGMVHGPRDLAITLGNYNEALRHVKWYVMKAQDVPNSMLPVAKEADLEKYFNENRNKFYSPERRDLQVVTIPTMSFKKEFKANDTEIEEEYGHYQASLMKGEKRQIARIDVIDKNVLARITEALKKGVPLDSLAYLVPKGSLQVAKLGWVTMGQLPGNISQELFNLDKKQFSKPLSVGKSASLFFIEDIDRPKIPALAKIKDHLESEVLAQKARDKALEVVKQVEDALASGESMEEIATREKLFFAKYPKVDKQGRGEAHEIVIHNEGERQAILKAAFSQSKNEDGAEEDKALELPNGDFAFVKVDKVIASQPLDFVQARGAVKTAFNKAQQHQVLKELAERYASGKDLTAKERQFIENTALPYNFAINRQGNILVKPELSDKNLYSSTVNSIENTLGNGEVLSAHWDHIFNLKIGEKISMVMKNSANANVIYLVAEVVKIEPKNINNSEDKINHYRKLLREMFYVDIMEAYFNGMMKEYSVKTYTK